MITQATGHDLSIDQSDLPAANVYHGASPSPYDMQNSSFALDELN